MTPDPTLFDNPVWGALTGRHAALARHAVDAAGAPAAARYDPEVGPFGAVRDPSDPAAWEAMATLVDPGRRVVVMLDADPGARGAAWPPAGWRVAADLPGVEMTGGPGLGGSAGPGLVELGPDDVPEMLDLVARTRPGPFEKRTVELGGYLGVRAGGALVAMAGRRFAPAGATEISAVCTDPSQRGRGLGARLVRAVAAGILGQGDVPFLHASATNTTAIALYERLGMTVRIPVRFVILTPAPPR